MNTLSLANEFPLIGSLNWFSKLKFLNNLSVYYTIQV